MRQGMGGRAFEALAADGAFAAVLDFRAAGSGEPPFRLGDHGGARPDDFGGGKGGAAARVHRLL
jgi:hypothetical protein